MTRHVAESDLALFASRDLSPWAGLRTRLHVSRCRLCAGRLEAYRIDRRHRLASAAEMPEYVDWERLRAEMAANIRVGLAAGECVAPREPKSIGFAFGWKPAAVMAGAVLVLSAAWVLNTPLAQTVSLGHSLRRIARGPAPADLDRGLVVEASRAGIELRQNGGSLALTQSGSEPVAVSVSVEGSASARFVDADTGQITVTSVYVQ